MPVLAAFVVAGGLASPVSAAIWQPLLAEPGRRMEIDRSSIEKDGEEAVRARGRVVFERPLPDAVSGSTFRVLESYSRFDCKERTFSTLQRVFKRDETEGIREENTKDPPVLPVRTGSLEDRVMRVACKPEGIDDAKQELAATIESVNDATKEMAEADEAKGKRILTASLGSGIRGRVAAPVRASMRRTAPKPVVPWGYEGEGGPDHWGELRPDYRLCASGQRQSPIDLKDGVAVDLPPVEFDFRPSLFRVTDNGRTLVVEVGENYVHLLGKRYTLVSLQFHQPGESTLEGRVSPMSAHFLLRAEDGRLLMVAVPLELGPENPALQTVLDHIPLEKYEPVEPPETALDLRAFVPVLRAYYTYMGSLSTPPCHEGVQWVVMKNAVAVSADQVAIFSRLYPGNARPLQAANGRLVKESR